MIRKEIIGICLIILVGCLGIMSGCTSPSSSSFELKSSTIVDDNGHAAMSISFETASNVIISIENSNGQTLGSELVGANEQTKIIEMGDLWETVNAGTYTLKASSGSETVFEKEYIFSGPNLIITDIETEWLYYSDSEEDVLDELRITMKNDGDLPVYPDEVNITIDSFHGPVSDPSLDGTPAEDVILPGETRTLEAIVYIPKISPASSHIVALVVEDNDGNNLAEFVSTETV